MLFTIIIWALLAVSSFVLGATLLNSIVGVDDREGKLPPLSHIMWIGLACMMVIALVSSLIAPLDGKPQLLIYSGITVFGFYNRKFLGPLFSRYVLQFRRLPLPAIIAVAVFFAAALYMSIIPPTHYDHGLYYAPSIAWIQSYGVVPGLGNLHPKLAFNSGWHVLGAFANIDVFDLDFSTKIGSYLLLLFGLMSGEGLYKIWRGDFRISNFLAALVLVPQHWLFSSDVGSPATDYPALYLSYVVIVLFIRKTEQNSLRYFDAETLVLISLISTIIAIKATASIVVIALIWLVALAAPAARKKVIIVTFLAGSLMAIPLLTRHVITSGYLFYPIYQVDLFDVDWKMPEDIVFLEVEETRRYGQFSMLPPHVVAAMSPSEWAPMWFAHMRLSERALIGLSAVLLLAIPAFLYWKRKALGLLDTQRRWGVFAVGSMIVFGLCYWLLVAPAMRMGYVWHFSLYLIAFAYILRALSMSYLPGRYVPLLATITIALFFSRALYTPVKEHGDKVSLAQSWIVPPELPTPKTEKKLLDGMVLHIPTEKDQCYDLLPCAPMLTQGLRLRDTANPAAGFRLSSVDRTAYYRRRLKVRRVEWYDYDDSQYELY